MSTNEGGIQGEVPESERTVIFNTQSPIEILSNLPRRVFPVSAKMRLDRTRAGDNPYEDYDPPDYPVGVRLPQPEPYIPQTMVHFDNPAERGPEGEIIWHPRDAIDALEDLFEHFRNETAVVPERLTVEGICVVEIPARHLTTDDGVPVASPTLYEDEADMRLAYFSKNASIMASDLREDLAEALPGDTRTPLRLTRLDEVTAKPSRSGRHTTQSAGRRQYYTHSEADKHNDLSKIPNIYKDRRMSRVGDESAPLVPVIQNIEQFLPSLADTDLIRTVEFSGATREMERFYAHEIIGGGQ